jgi:KNTase C-terminal domain
MRAGAVCGSVAHGAATRHSDVEVVVACDEAVAERDEYFFDEAVMVECAVVGAERLLASARSVPWNWGIKADAYRHQIEIWDPAGFFEQVRREARSIPDTEFQRALEESWWLFHELREKLRNAVDADDVPRAVHLGWEFAYAAAMRIALIERKHYESGRTLWTDAASRGYEMERLIRALTGGGSPVTEVTSAVDAVWSELSEQGVPSSARAAP